MRCPSVYFRKPQRVTERLTVAGAKNRLMRSVPGYHGLEIIMLIIDAIDHVVFNVQDVEASALWYARVLGMSRETAEAVTGEMRTSMTFGRNKINLRPITAPQDRWMTGRKPCAGSQDLCFLTSQPPTAVIDHLRDCGIDVELGPVTKRGARGPICSVYVRDPDGNLIEISSYE
jgi:catechol 2,3-dioxygenase-like lactoylglutathione lyase family enzyme